jgi:hypothetical protein
MPEPDERWLLLGEIVVYSLCVLILALVIYLERVRWVSSL